MHDELGKSDEVEMTEGLEQMMDFAGGPELMENYTVKILAHSHSRVENQVVVPVWDRRGSLAAAEERSYVREWVVKIQREPVREVGHLALEFRRR